jgi:hypothetical protein
VFFSKKNCKKEKDMVKNDPAKQAGELVEKGFH